MSDESFEDKVNRIHNAEQAGAALDSMAETLHSYYASLMAKGFPEDRAFELTVRMQETVFHQYGPQ